LDLAWDAPELARFEGTKKASWGYLVGVSALLHAIFVAALVLVESFGFHVSGDPGALGEFMRVGLYGSLPGDLDGGDGQVAGAGELAEPYTAEDDPRAAEPETESDPPPPPENSLVAPDPEAISLTPPPEPLKEESQPQKDLEKEEPKPKVEAKPKAEAKPKVRPPLEDAAKNPIKETQRKGPGAISEAFGPGKGGFGEGTGLGEGQNADKPGGGGGGGQGDGGGGLKGYIDGNYKYIVRLIKRKMIYPAEAKKNGVTGTATIAFNIEKNGQVSNVRLNRSSGDRSLDEAAISAVQRAAPFPAPPAAAKIAIPLVFSLR
jgi:protein TonB